MGPLIAEFGRA
ncbi:hypothetical protein ECPA14_3556, partial [Escherichia coli PA14]